MQGNFKRSLAIGIAALVVLAAFFVGLYFGKNAPVFSNPIAESNDFSIFWKAWNIVEEKYVDANLLERQNLIYGAISGLVGSLGDPYSVFFPPEENAAFQSEIRGEFEGVGMEVGLRNNIITVIAPLKNTPAERAGVEAGDIIVRIDEEEASGLSLEEAVRRIRGPRGSEVRLTVARNNEKETRVIPIFRDVISIPILDTETHSSDRVSINNSGVPSKTEMDSGDVFVVRLYNFSEQSPQVFRNALREMLEQKKFKLILDLRNNPGGFLEAAVDIASWFLPQGTPVVIEDFGDKTSQKIHRSRGYNIFQNLPMVILINEGSASASEIVAGALRDHDIATLVGERTFGKGSVQELVPLTADTSVKITIAKWLTPNGESFSGIGLTPDVEAKITSEDMQAGRDPAMEKALELLQQKNISN